VPNSRASWLALLGLAALAGPAVAAPNLQPQPGAERPVRAPTIPAALRSTVSVNGAALIVRMNDGSPHRFDMSELYVDKLEAFQDGRFIGFEIGGNEEYGYVLIDRTGRGEPAESHTGSRPSFSEDGRYFAAAEISESGFGNLNGVALWEVRPSGVKRLFYTDSVRSGFHWRAEPFRQPSCVPITAVEEGWEPTAPDRWDAEVANAPRAWYELRWSDEDGIYFGRSTDAACFDDSSG
jgi:hypothetical protein